MGAVLSTCVKSEDHVEETHRAQREDDVPLTDSSKSSSSKSMEPKTSSPSTSTKTVVVVEEFDEEILGSSEDEEESNEKKPETAVQESKPSGGGGGGKDSVEFTTNPFLTSPELSAQESPVPSGSITKSAPRKSRTSTASTPRGSDASISSVDRARSILGMGSNRSSPSTTRGSPSPTSMTEGAKVKNLERENLQLVDENVELKLKVEELLEANKSLKEENAKLKRSTEAALSKANALQRGLERADTKVLTNKMSVETVIDGDIQYEIITDEDNDVVLGQRLIKTDLSTGKVLEDREVTEEEVEQIVNGEY